MHSSMVSSLLGLITVGAVGLFPLGCQSGGIGDPCVPEDEYQSGFAGFKVTEENIESRSFQCESRICLVNHLQGRVSCPLGQPPIVDSSLPGRHACSPDTPGTCAGSEQCVPAEVSTRPCDPGKPDQGAADCAGHGSSCHPEGRFCQCNDSSECAEAGAGFHCDASDKRCKSFVCHQPGNCQSTNAAPEQNRIQVGGGDPIPKDCCVPGTDTPVTSPVCGQCDKASRRSAEDAVYCSCRCGPVEGEVDDGTSTFCECPSGYACEEIRPNLNLGDEQLTGKYCIKEGTRFTSESACGLVDGFTRSDLCEGLSRN